MSEYLIQGDTLTGIADAIREKLGSSDGIDPAQMAELIKGIQSGGGEIKINGLNVLCGTFVLETDYSSGYYTVQCGQTESTPTKLYSMFYTLDNFLNNSGGVSHMQAGLGVTYAQGEELRRRGVYLYSLGSGGNTTPSTLGADDVARWRNGNALIDIYTPVSPLRAGVLYGWLFMYE